MRALIQRVSQAEVRVDGKTVGAIGRGLLLLVGVTQDDTTQDAAYLAEKSANLRLFPNEQGGRFDRSLLDIDGEALVVSQFTLYAETRRGRRPSFTAAAPPQEAESLIEEFVTRLRAMELRVQEGQFGATMHVESVNDGPVTIMVDSADRERSRRAATGG